MTWHQAQRFCRRLGGDLVKITNARENEFVLALARKSAPTRKQVWIGLMWTANDFYWSDYSVPVYKAWAPNEPNGKSREPCSNMWTGYTSVLPIRASGYWNDMPCTVSSHVPFGLVCKKLAWTANAGIPKIDAGDLEAKFGNGIFLKKIIR